jgi:hypothetical protein
VQARRDGSLDDYDTVGDGAISDRVSALGADAHPVDARRETGEWARLSPSSFLRLALEGM